MTEAPTATRPDRFTMRWLLLGEPGAEGGPDPLAELLAQDHVLDSADKGLTSVSGAMHRVVGREIAKVVDGVLELDVVDVLVGGWRRHRILKEAARRTLTATDAEEIIDLATHRITLKHEPHVDVMLDGAPVARVAFALEVTADVKGFVATVERGRLVAFDAGRCLVRGKLSAEGVKLVERELDMALPLVVVHLGDGLELLTAEERTAVAAAARQAAGDGRQNPDRS